MLYNVNLVRVHNLSAFDYYCDGSFEATFTFRRLVTGLINHHQNKKPKDEND